MIVVDASLAAKLFIDEVDSDTVEHWYRGVGEVGAPDVIVIEVVQAIVRRVNSREGSLANGLRALESWRSTLEDGGIVLFRSNPADVDTAARIALNLGHPVKDCLYLALALEHGTPLVTCDAKFAAKAQPAYPNVRLLADYAS